MIRRCHEPGCRVPLRYADRCPEHTPCIGCAQPDRPPLAAIPPGHRLCADCWPIPGGAS